MAWFWVALGLIFISIFIIAWLYQINENRKEERDLIESRQANDGTGTSELM